VNIRPENTFIPDGSASDAEAECTRYNAVISSLDGIDLQLLGIGENGHIGFNEPGEAFERETHLVRLSESTLLVNAQHFPRSGKIPTHAFTMGIKSIMQAKKILLVASGQNKANALYAAFRGPITPNCPASILQLHNDVTVVADDVALQYYS
jgi:glucosamine-6-phosphate deaminase